MSISEPLARKLEALRALNLPAEPVSRFGEAIDGASDWDLFHVNPFHFADVHGISSETAVDLFVASARVGLFDLDWNLVCHMCGGIQRTITSIEGLGDGRFYCAPCEQNVDGVLDEQVEVSFTINPTVRELHIDSFADYDSYEKSYFTSSYVWPEEMDAYFNEGFIAFVPLEPNGFARLETTLEAGRKYRVVSYDAHAACWIHTDGDARLVDVELHERGFAEPIFHARPGPIHVQIHNRQPRRSGVIILRMDLERVYALAQRHPRIVLPFLSGKMLLNHQGFRDLFKTQTAAQNLSLNVRSLTLLFTDLRSSTALYDRIGDVEAYRLIQDHFRILHRVVRDNAGAIVKTMGDAIMATFSTPRDGVRAALQMARDFQALADSVPDLGLKIGLHEGPALVINADGRLDYFGQTVNVAARVQGLAGAGELVATDVILAGYGVDEALRDQADRLERTDVALRGVAQKVGVHRFRIRVPAGVGA